MPIIGSLGIFRIIKGLNHTIRFLYNMIGLFVRSDAAAVLNGAVWMSNDGIPFGEPGDDLRAQPVPATEPDLAQQGLFVFHDEDGPTVLITEQCT